MAKIHEILARNGGILDLMASGRLISKVVTTSTDGFKNHRAIRAVQYLDGKEISENELIEFVNKSLKKRTSVLEDRIEANSLNDRPSIRESFDVIAQERAWNKDLQIEILLLYISQNPTNEFSEWLEKFAPTC